MILSNWDVPYRNFILGTIKAISQLRLSLCSTGELQPTRLVSPSAVNRNYITQLEKGEYTMWLKFTHSTANRITRCPLTGISLCRNHKPFLHNVFAKNLQTVDHKVQTEVYFASTCEERPKHRAQNALREKLTMLWLQFTSLQALSQESTKRDFSVHSFSNLLNWQRICKIHFAVLTCQQSNSNFCSSWSLVIWYFAWSHHIFFLTHNLYSCISSIKLGVWRAFSFKPWSLQVVWQVLYTWEHFLKFDSLSLQRYNTKPLNSLFVPFISRSVNQAWQKHLKNKLTRRHTQGKQFTFCCLFTSYLWTVAS